MLQSTFLKALGWSLLDSLWQMGSLWIVYLLITRNGKKLSANQRHNLAFLSLAAGALWFLATIVMNLGAAGENFALSAASLGFLKLVSSFVEPALPYLSAVYLGITLFLVIRLFHRYRHTGILTTQSVIKASPELRIFTAQLAMQLGIKKPVRLLISHLVHTPLTIGFWKPVILLPVALINNLSLKQTESLILHELYHIQRNDFLMNLLVAFVDILLFFNPFARFFKNTIQQEREHRCDDIVVQFRYDAGAYAEALLVLEQKRATTTSAALAATGPNKYLLLARVKRLLTGEPMSAPVNQKLVVVLLVALVISMAGLYNPGKRLIPVLTLSEMPAGSASLEAQPVIETKFSQSSTAPSTTEKSERGNAVVEMDPDIESSVAAIIVSETIAEIFSEMKAEPAPVYVSMESTSPFTLSFDPPNPQEPLVPNPPDHPFVPSRSFEYYDIKEFTPHGNHLRPLTPDSPTELRVNWDLIEKEVEAAASAVDISRLQAELDKALSKIDWEKLRDTDPKKGLELVDRSVKAYKLKIAALTREQREKAIRSQERNQQPDSTRPTKRTITSLKKIVDI